MSLAPSRAIPKRLILARAFAFAFSASLLVALLGVAQQKWFGSGDLQPFALYTVIFAALVTAVGSWAYRLLARFPIWLRFTIGGAVGLALGFMFTVVNWLLLGGWFGAWSVPVLAAWLGGGMLGVAAAAGTRSGIGVARHAVEVLSFLCLLLGLSFGLPWAAKTMTRDQELTLVYARLYPDMSAPTIEDSRGILLPGDRELIERGGIPGRVVVLGGHASNTVQYPQARILILVSKQLIVPIRLPQPYASSVVYWQSGDTFQQYPEQVHLLDRAVELVPDKSRPGVTGYWVEHASGARSGADLYDWSREP